MIQIANSSDRFFADGYNEVYISETESHSFCVILTLWQNESAGTLQSEGGGVRLGSALGQAERVLSTLVGVSRGGRGTRTAQVGHARLRRSVQAEGACSGRRLRIVLGNVASRLGRHVGLLGNQVVDALFELHFI